MPEKETDAGITVSLDDEIEGDRDIADDFAFVRIGASVPLKPSASAFDLQTPPSQPIAISQRHHLLFLAHSQGFFVARTSDVVQIAKEIKEGEIKKGEEGPSVEKVCLVDVKSAGQVSILAVSGDESTLAAAAGPKIFLFAVASLLNKDQEPFFSCSLDDPDIVKDLKWQKNKEKSFVVLSSLGLLYHGTLEADLKKLMDDVDAVEWSPDGGFLSVARKHTMKILSSNFKQILSLPLSFESWPLIDAEYTIMVDSIRWLRSDSITIGCFQMNEDGEEEGYLIQVIKSKQQNFSEVSCNPVMYSFADLFDGMWDILPFGSGPYLLASYLDYWEVEVVSNKKAIDQHISLLKWSGKDDRREVVSLEFCTEKYTPKILLENGDENLVLGFCVEKSPSCEKIEIQVNHNVTELAARCMLVCLTSEGKLNLFHAARVSESSDLLQREQKGEGSGMSPPTLTSSSPVPSGPPENAKLNSFSAGSHGFAPQPPPAGKMFSADPTSSNFSSTKPLLGHAQEKAKLNSTPIAAFGAPFGYQSAGNLFGATIGTSPFTASMSAFSDSQEKAKFDSPPIAASRTAFGLQSAGNLFVANMGASSFNASRPVFQEKAKLNSSSTASSGDPFGSQSAGNLVGANMSASVFNVSRSVLNDPQENAKLNSSSTATSGAAFGSQSAGNLFGANMSTSPFSASRSVLNDPQETQGKDSQSIWHSSPSSGIVAESDYKARGSHPASPEVTLPGNFQYSKARLEDIRGSKLSEILNYESDRQKQFYNVKDMVHELDVLLSFIEREGGFRDACTVFQRSSISALENVIGELSELSHKCKKEAGECLLEIQQLENKMLQISARQGYMKGIVEQAADRNYWDIWSQKKLSPELEAKRHNILKTNLNLTNQIIELEKYFNSIEINRFCEGDRTSVDRLVSRGGLLPARQKQSLQSLQSVYNTLNSQLAAAEHLSDCLSKQMSELKINTAPTKQQSVKKELFESIGLSDEIVPFQSPVSRRPSIDPDSIRRTPPSTVNAVKEYSAKKALSIAKSFEPETARRRRDSLARNWATFEPPKTTVKRSMQAPHSVVSADKPFRKAKENFDSELAAFAIQQKRNVTPVSSSSQLLGNRGMPESISEQVIDSQSNSAFRRTKDLSDASRTLVSKSHTEGGAQIGSSLPQLMSRSQSVASTSPATQTAQPSNLMADKGVAGFRNSNLKFSAPVPPKGSRLSVETKEQTSKNLHLSKGEDSPAFSLAGSTTQFADSSVSVSSIRIGSNIGFPSSPPTCTSAEVNSKSTEFNKPSTTNHSSEPSSNLSFHSKTSDPTSSPSPHPVSSTVIATTPPPTPAFSTFTSFVKPSLTAKPSTLVNQTTSFSTTMSTVNNLLTPSSTSAPGESQNSEIHKTTPLTPSLSSGKPSGISANAKSAVPNQVASSSTSASQSSNSSFSSTSTLFSQPQKSSSSAFTSSTTESRSHAAPEPTVTSVTTGSVHLDKIGSKPQPAAAESQASAEVESDSKKENRLLPTSSDSNTPSVSVPVSQPEIPPSTPLLSTNVAKDEHSSVSLSQEDDMEEEAPDTTGFNLGSLGGFGLGSTPSSTGPKPNPFGGSFLTASSSTPSPPLTSAAPAGEPFRPASFTLPPAQPVQTSTPASSTGFSSGFGGGGFSGFGQPAQFGAGQQALGSVLGSFGQSRQIGSGVPGTGFPSPLGGSGGGSSPASNSGGFGTAAGFATPAAGGFSSVAPSGGGFAAVAKGGGGFAALASGGGFAGVAAGAGFGGAAQGSGFSMTAPAAGVFGGAAAGAGFSGGFAGAATGAGFTGGGFGAVAANQGGGGFSAFSGNAAGGTGPAGKPPAALFTQMRK